METSPDSNSPEKFHLVAHEVFLRLKNRKGDAGQGEGEGETGLGRVPPKFEEKPFKPPKMLKFYIGFLQILGDWLIDVGVAGYHFYEGRYIVGGLTLGFVFIGGFFVTLNLHVLMRRRGDKEFKAELKKIHPILLCLIYVPSLLPLFSAGLEIRTARKLHKLNPVTDKMEIKRLERLLKICEEHSVTDVLYESSYEAYGQAILQMLSLVEKREYTSIIEFIPLLGAFFAWLEVTMPPIKLAESLNNIKVKWTEVLAGLGNKGVTLLSFALFTAASRRHFANYLEGDPMTLELILATAGAILFLAIFSEVPGIVVFRLEIRSKVDHKAYKKIKIWEFLANIISLVIPVAALTFWVLTLYFNDELLHLLVYVVCGLFLVLFFIAIAGFFAHGNLPWLGQFSTDILLLLYIGIYSRVKKLAFQQIDFHFDAHDINGNLEEADIGKKRKQKEDSNNNN